MNHGNFFSIQTMGLVLMLLCVCSLGWAQTDSTDTYISFGLWDDDNLPFRGVPGGTILTAQDQLRVLDSLGIIEEGPTNYDYYKFVFTFTDSVGDTLQQTYPLNGSKYYEKEYDLNNLPSGVSFYTDSKDPDRRYFDFRLDMRIDLPSQGKYLTVYYEIWAKTSGGSYQLLLGQGTNDYYTAQLCPTCLPGQNGSLAFQSTKSSNGKRLGLESRSEHWAYPNPFQGNVLIAPHETETQLEISNLQGQRLLQLQIPASSDPYKLNLSQLPPGTYLFSRVSQHDRQRLRLINQ